jgi:hypothetical protein
MALITKNMQLTLWNDLDDPYDSAQLVDNFAKLDAHNHEGGLGGVQLDGSKAIAKDTITANQLGTNSVGPDELADYTSDSSDANRPVTTNSIQNYSVTNNKLAVNAVDNVNIIDNSVTIDKLNSNSFRVPTYVHSGNGSLPTTRFDGGNLYSGYIIDYTDNLDPLKRTYLWRLRYAATYNGLSHWEYVGGRAYEEWRRTGTNASTILSTGSGPVPGQYYLGWGDPYQSFQGFKLPLAGTWKVTTTCNAQIEYGYHGVLQSGLYLGTQEFESSYPGTRDNSAYTTAYSHFSGVSGGVGDQTTVIHPNTLIISHSNGPKVLRQLFGVSAKWQYTVSGSTLNINQTNSGNVSILFQRMHVEPYGNIRNYSS